MNQQLVTELKKIISDVRENSNNIRIDNYVKTKNRYRTKEGKSNVEVDISVDYGELIKEAIRELNQVRRTKIRSVASKYDVDVSVVEEQLDKVREQMQGRLDRYEPANTDPDDGYVYLGSNVKIKTDTGDIYITGLTVNEQKIIQAEYKDRNKRLNTKIKDEFRNDLKINNLKTYKLEPREFYKLKVV